MTAASKVSPRDTSRKAGAVKVSAQATSVSTLHVVNGRIVSPTLNDPDVKRQVRDAMAEHRKSDEALLRFYVSQGVLTKDGKLSKKFGGR